MNFPMELPIFQFFYWLVNTAGLGGVITVLVGSGSVLIYTLTHVWFRKGAEADERDTYTYPAPTLGHDESE